MHDADRALSLILTRNENKMGDLLKSFSPERRAIADASLEIWFPRLFNSMKEIYGHRWDFLHYLEEACHLALSSFAGRDDSLMELDRHRQLHPDWFTSSDCVGMMMYTDLFAGSLEGIGERIPYLQELGIRYLHLLPVFQAPEGNSDGGYAISSYRHIRKDLGTMQDLKRLSAKLRQAGISLVLDFVFNHTSDEHLWAVNARQAATPGDGYYYFFSQEERDRYQPHLRDIFPETRQGSFTWLEDPGCWVWTTFHSFQWDLNYANPEVFIAMLGEMFFLLNQGVEVLRLDALAFVWKEAGTSCENLPGAHSLIRAFRAAAGIAAPAAAFKSEAIVHPDEVAKYISPAECEISYNPLLMALLWESLATRKTTLLEASLRKRFSVPQGCAWVNYVRCHDDIGWTFADEDAAGLGIDGAGHRRFLNDFYTGKFPGSFSRGVPFGYNQLTGDCRISGTCASLSGIEKGMEQSSAAPESSLLPEILPYPVPGELEAGIRRHVLIHSILFSLPGIPVIYSGDENAMLNRYEYSDDPHLHEDSRWIHRMAFSQTSNSVTPRIFTSISQMIRLRRDNPAFGHGSAEFIETANTHLLGYVSGNAECGVCIIANVNDYAELMLENLLRIAGFHPPLVDILNPDSPLQFQDESLVIPPLTSYWLVPKKSRVQNEDLKKAEKQAGERTPGHKKTARK